MEGDAHVKWDVTGLFLMRPLFVKVQEQWLID